MKEHTISKLKKEYLLYINRIFFEKNNQVETMEGSFLYSKLYLTPFQALPSNTFVQVPNDYFLLYLKKKFLFTYRIVEVNHEKKTLHAQYVGLNLANFLNYSKKVEFNLDLTLTKNYALKTKLMLSRDPEKPCSKKVQKEVKEEVKKILSGWLELTLPEITKQILSKNFSKNVGSAMTKNQEYFRSITVLKVS